MEHVYNNPKHPAAYGGVAALAKATGSKREDAKKFLLQNRTYRKFLQNKNNFERARIMVSSLGHTFQADLFDLGKFSRLNKGNRFLLLVIDCFSRLIKVRPIKNKSAEQVALALDEIFTELRQADLLGIRSLIGTDLGTEFWNKDADEIYEKHGIIHYALRSPKKASMAEISGRYLLDRIYKHMHDRGENVWVDRIQDFVSAKNRRRNTKIGMAPVEVTYENQASVYKELFGKSGLSEKPLDIGQKVQLALDKLPFHKSFHGYFSEKVYEIIRRTQYNGIYRYSLVDTSDDNAEISGTFYQAELLPFEKE